MKRRKLLKGIAAAGVSMFAGPAWLREAFGAEVCPPDADKPADGHTSAYARALARAQAAGKPLLVLVIPADAGARYTRGSQFGAFLNCATPAQLAPLALAEVVCAPAADAGIATGDPLLILVDGTAQAIPLKALDPKERHEDASLDRAIDQLAGAVKHALAADAPMLERRAAATRKAIGADEAARIDRLIAGGGPELAEVADRGAALIAAVAALHQAGSARLDDALGAAAIARLRAQPPPGAKWGLAGGCGAVIEGEPAEERGYSCGMGCVPEKARRFLSFFTRP